MSLADKLFIDMCRDILDNGTDTKGEKVRPHWEDTGEAAYTIKRFGVVNRYDLRKEFPALTLRKTGLKTKQYPRFKRPYLGCLGRQRWLYRYLLRRCGETKIPLQRGRSRPDGLCAEAAEGESLQPEDHDQSVSV